MKYKCFKIKFVNFKRCAIFMQNFIKLLFVSTRVTVLGIFLLLQNFKFELINVEHD